MAVSERDLLVLSRRRYELGRAWAGAVGALVVVPMALASFAGCDRPGGTLACSALLAFLVAGAIWHGRETARAVRPGLLAGLPPLLLPLVAGGAQRVCAADWCLFFPAACVIGGLAGGIVLGWRVGRRAETTFGFWLPASLIAALAGSLGCLVGGASGLIGMTLGFSAAAGPLIAASRRAST
jgi:hypothetical protein